MINIKHLNHFRFLVILFGLAFTIEPFTIQAASIAPSDTQITPNKLFTAAGKPTDALRELLTVTGIPVDPADRIPEINAKIVAAGWISPPGTEYPDMQLPASLKSVAPHIINIIGNKLHFNQPLYPDPKVHFDGVLYLGASFHAMAARIEFYNQLVDDGLLPADLKMYVLTGERKASAEKFGESPEAFLKFAREKSSNPSLELTPEELPTNELEIIKFLFQHTPPKASSVEYIYSPKDPTHTRATTDSTMISFLEKVKDSGTFVAVSNQPYGDYQQSVLALRIAKCGRHNIKVYTVGDCPSDASKKSKTADNHAAILLYLTSKIIGNLAELEKLKAE